MAESRSPQDAPDEPGDKHPRLCFHVWVTDAPHKARCTTCGLVVPITTEEVGRGEVSP